MYFFCLFLIIILFFLVSAFYFFYKKINKKDIKDDVSVSKSIFHSLSSSLGTGNILGVGVVISIYGVGVLFWMGVQSIFGFFLKFYETYFTLYYRKRINNKNIGGPMYYMEYGLNKKYLGIIYSILCLFCCFTIGNIVQIKAFDMIVFNDIKKNKNLIVICFILFLFISIYKGIKRISKILEKVVPIMITIYVVICFYILYINKNILLNSLILIVKEAFNINSLKGLILYGFLRGTFTNEAGLGSGSISYGISEIKNIKKCALLEGLTPLIDTLFMCTITGLVIIVSKINFNSGEMLFVEAIKIFLNDKGVFLSKILIILFAYASIIGWYYYGEVSYNYIFKTNKTIFLIAYLIFSLLSFYIPLDFAFVLSDIATILLSLLNFIVLGLLTIKFLKMKKIR